MTRRWLPGLVWCVLGPVFLASQPAWAEERYAIVVSGVSGGEKYADQQRKWRDQIATFLTTGLGFPDANLVMLDGDRQGSAAATAENVRRVFADLQRRTRQDDMLLLVLLGHGTFDGVDAKFNLAGPDLDAAGWKSAIDALAGQVVVVNTTESSFPFLEALSAKGRVVITATDSAGQRFATVFPEYFIRSLVDGATDADKNGRVSIMEAFDAASAGVRLHYEQRGQLSTERPLIDDDGDGTGREAGAPGEDGALARTIYLDAGPEARTAGDPEIAALERQRLGLEARLQELKERKPSMTDDEYQTELEAILIELARISQRIRQRS